MTVGSWNVVSVVKSAAAGMYDASSGCTITGVATGATGTVAATAQSSPAATRPAGQLGGPSHRAASAFQRCAGQQHLPAVASDVVRPSAHCAHAADAIPQLPTITIEASKRVIHPAYTQWTSLGAS